MQPNKKDLIKKSNDLAIPILDLIHKEIEKHGDEFGLNAAFYALSKISAGIIRSMSYAGDFTEEQEMALLSHFMSTTDAAIQDLRNHFESTETINKMMGKS